MSFYGSTAPYLDGLKIVTSSRTLSAGTVDVAGQERRTKYFPSDDGAGNYNFEFFGFDTQDQLSADFTTVSIQSVSLAMYDPVEFENNKAVIDNYEENRAEIADDNDAATLGLQELRNQRRVAGVIVNS